MLPNPARLLAWYRPPHLRALLLVRQGFARVNASNRPMTLCGTDDWMAPEMIMGFQYDNKVDVFSYGIVRHPSYRSEPLEE